jgi:hypothetical protein
LPICRLGLYEPASLLACHVGMSFHELLDKYQQSTPFPSDSLPNENKKGVWRNVIGTPRTRHAKLINQTTLPYLQPGHLLFRPVALRPQVSLSLPLQDSLPLRDYHLHVSLSKATDSLFSHSIFKAHQLNKSQADAVNFIKASHNLSIVFTL